MSEMMNEESNIETGTCVYKIILDINHEQISKAFKLTTSMLVSISLVLAGPSGNMLENYHIDKENELASK